MWEGVTLEGATLEGATLEGATFEGATLEGVDVRREWRKVLVEMVPQKSVLFTSFHILLTSLGVDLGINI